MSECAFDETACRQRLLEGSQCLDIVMVDHQLDQLIAYLMLLHKWNKAYNLTAIRDPLEMVGRHLLDSLAILPYFHSDHCLDMGTGAGLPGIPLAIMRPDSTFVLLDSNSKKVRFLRQVILELGLENCTQVHHRLESFQPASPIKLLVARAFTNLATLVKLSAHLLGPQSELLAMKGQTPDLEIAAVCPPYRCETIFLQVPFINGSRCLIRIRS
jgi:16S rRNA (guanine527-N7)-methyltransferase